MSTQSESVIKKLEKYKINMEDWDSPMIAVVEMKMKAQNTISAFAIISNSLAGQLHPELSDKIDSLEVELLEYLDYLMTKIEQN